MKKIFGFVFVLIISIAMSFSANAQWQYFHEDADELTGKDAYDMNVFLSSNEDAFIIYSNTTYVVIQSDRGIFDYDDKKCISVLIGFYEGKTLIEKCTTKFLVTRSGDTAFSTDMLSSELGKKIIKHLKTKGNVRIIASKYSGSTFDITIPKNPNIKTSVL